MRIKEGINLLRTRGHQRGHKLYLGKTNFRQTFIYIEFVVECFLNEFNYTLSVVVFVVSRWSVKSTGFFTC